VPAPTLDVRPVADDQWDVVAWLWQAFRHDLAPVLGSYPQPDGRYKHDRLTAYPAADRTGYLLWAPHPETGEDAPVGLALVTGLDGPRRNLSSLFVVAAARSAGTGHRFALDVLARHEAPWTVAFQHDNHRAGSFWRRVADAAFGPDGWTEEQRAVPHRPDLPPDHWIESRQ